MTTIDTLTAKQVTDLAAQADQHGDESMSADCHAVLDSWYKTVQLGEGTNVEALGRVVAALNYAEAQV